jgi:hypothetical protein
MNNSCFSTESCQSASGNVGSIITNESYIILAVIAALALVALIYLLSPLSLLEDITTRGAEIRVRLHELLARRPYPTDTKTVLVIGYIDTALEHHESIWHLIERKNIGSAFALARPVFDSLFRALWINGVATDEQIEKASRDELDWRRIRLRADIRRVYFGAPDDAETLAKLNKVFDSLDELWKAMCSYTHSGALQLSRRFTFDEVKPNYPDREIARLLSYVTTGLLWCLPQLFLVLGREGEGKETVTLLHHYNHDFAERLQKGQ